jgi:hypothetical protein
MIRSLNLRSKTMRPRISKSSNGDERRADEGSKQFQLDPLVVLDAPLPPRPPANGRPDLVMGIMPNWYSNEPS